MNNYRVTSLSRVAQALRATRQHNQATAKYQEQLQTGLRINRPSDDPVKLRALIAHQNDQQRFASENNNIQAARLHLNTSVTRLLEAKDLVVQVKSIALSASGEFERDLLADQVQQVHDHLVRVGNAQLGDDFLFSGTALSTRPFEVDSATGEVVFVGTDARQEIVVGRELTVEISYSGNEIFFHGGVSVFQVLDDFQTA
ncbi:MAG: hypothetical protein AAF497_24375, partial [Planctomycetota bacterium]